MTQEKRRYFRINETVGLSYELLDRNNQTGSRESVDIWDLISDQDESIERLLKDVSKESPKVAALIRAINQKLERIVSQVVMESKLTNRLANRVREVNLSACGAGFLCDENVDVGTALQLELQLFPGSKKVQTKARVVGCDEMADGFYWRVDFFDITAAVQETLIQHIVQRQSAQLKTRRDR